MNNKWISNFAIWIPNGFLESSPSMRLRRLNLIQPLRNSHNINAHLVYTAFDALKFDNILLCHFNEEVNKFCKLARSEGKTLYFCHSEALFDLPGQKEVFNQCDFIICCSTKLAELTQNWITSKFTKCVVIPDMAELPHPRHIPQEKQQLKVGWVGMGGNSYLAENIRPIIEKLDMKLIIISEYPNADVRWNRDTYAQELSKCDICICPQNQIQPAKSNVKLTLAMSLGLPTIGSNSQAYSEIIKNGFNGFLASSLEEWELALSKLKDFQLRKLISKNAVETALDFHPIAIAKKYKELLISKRPKIAFINNSLPQKYLSYGDSVLESLRSNGAALYEQFYYEDLDLLGNSPISNLDISQFSMFIFIEVRYSPDEVLSSKNWNIPKVLITKEDQNINNFSFFNLIITPNKELADKWFQRGFVNVYFVENLDSLNYEFIQELLEKYLPKRLEHNFKIHDLHINQFNVLLTPEQRWKNGVRDEYHLEYSLEHTNEGDNVLDVGSADGFLSLYLATNNRNVSCLEFVQRGIDHSLEHAKRLGAKLDIRKGFIEKVDSIFKDKKFNVICLFEILEHLDYWKLPYYLEKIESLLTTNGKILISLPKQDLNDNPEHLWSPKKELIFKLLRDKPLRDFRWVEMPNHSVEGNWFISYEKSKSKEFEYMGVKCIRM